MRKKLIIGCVGIALIFGATVLVTPRSDGPPPLPAPTLGNEQAPTFAFSGMIQADDEALDGATPTRDTSHSSQVSYAYPRKPSASKSTQIVTIDDKQYPLRTYRPAMTVNDPYANQWWESSATVDAAWDIPRGNNATTLAIIDTGFALAHQEFTGRWATNDGETGVATSEAPSSLNCADRGLALDASCNLIDDDFDRVIDNESGAVPYQNPSRLNCSDQGKALTKDCNRIDDDSNGYVDDLRGWDFINYDNSVQAGELNPAGDGTTHGTMVAGIAAATGNNGVGIAGVDWSTKILPLQALDDDSYGDTRSVGRAIRYAVERDVDVISISLGSNEPDDFIRDAVQAALARGIVVVASSGNDGCDCMVYPAKYPEVVAVGALDSNLQPAYFSSWGSTLDILAPGTQMTSPTWTSAYPTNAYASGINGTSFAAPMVGGLMTRLLSSQPNATPQQLIAAVTENTNRSGLSTPSSTTRGFGSLDAHKVTQRMTTPLASSQIYAFTPAQQGSFLSPATPLELGGSYVAYSCETGSSPATAIYELRSASSTFFTISKVEQQKALAQGYSSSIFTHACVTQPHDTPTVVRNLNIFREFYNKEPPR